MSFVRARKQKEKSRLRMCKRWRRRAVNRVKYNENIECNSTFVSFQFRDLCISGGKEGIFQQKFEMYIPAVRLGRFPLFSILSKEGCFPARMLFIPQTKSSRNGQCEWMWKWLSIAYWANERNGMEWTKGARWTDARGAQEKRGSAEKWNRCVFVPEMKRNQKNTI